jgi:hypothetical protein
MSVGEYNVNDYLKMINIVYDKFELDPISKSNSNQLKTLFKTNSIICNDSKNDDNERTQWKSRDILPQAQIFIGDVELTYTNMNDYEYEIFMKTISISAYNLSKLRNSCIENDITIINSNKKMKILSIDKKFYDSEFGIKYDEIINNNTTTFEII